ncbi:MAG: hypothetical protein D6B27_04110 [Gammaproteobacteria bacterium]|nr:MAG: hypothetical protein D6B27_04110 [Gammaproteobacteria bacterium]
MKFKTIFLAIILIFIQYSNAKSLATIRKEEQQRQKEMMITLENYVSNTNYCALIQYTSVDAAIIPDDSSKEKHTYHAKVRETFRGPKYENITYTAIVKKGESSHISSRPIVITLCHNKEGLWGLDYESRFPAQKKIIEATKKIIEKTKDQKKFGFCK